MHVMRTVKKTLANSELTFVFNSFIKLCDVQKIKNTTINRERLICSLIVLNDKWLDRLANAVFLKRTDFFSFISL